MNNVLKLRTSLSMTQDEFAEYCNVSRISIARYEAGAEIHRANAVKIASACGVSVEYVIGVEEKKQEPDWPWPDNTDETIRIMARGMGRMTQENREKLLNVAKTLFAADFDEADK